MKDRNRVIVWSVAGALVIILIYFALQGTFGVIGADGASNSRPSGEYATQAPD